MARPVEGPFSAPAGTTFRFGTLILLAASVTAMWYWLFSTIWRPVGGDTEARCQVTSGYYTPMGAWLSPQDQAKLAQFHRCMARITPNSTLWVVSSLVVLALVTLLLFAVEPFWRVRRSRWVTVGSPQAPASVALRHELDELVRAAGLTRPPWFLVDPHNARPTGRAFGGFGRHRVLLSAGLVVQQRQAPQKFRVLVLHELAHLRNGDLTITYLTLAVWRAFVLVTVLPALISLTDPVLLTPQPLRNPLRAGWAVLTNQLIDLGWFFPVLIALVYVSRTAVLRAREGYADARAAQWLDQGALRETLLTSAELDGTRWWHTHPKRLARVRLLERPERLLRPGFWETFTAGFAIQIASGYAHLAVQSSSDAPAGAFADQAPYDGATLLTAVVLVIAALRGAAFVRSGGDRRWVYVRAGLGLGLGLTAAFGLTIMRDGLLLRHAPASTEEVFTSAGLARDLLLVALLLPSVVVLCQWAGYCAQLLGAAGRRRTLVALVAAVAASWACLRWWNILNYGVPPLADTLAGDASMWRQFVLQADWTGTDWLVVRAVFYPFVLLFLLGPAALFTAPLLWLLPLLLGAARREAVRSAARAGTVAALLWLLVDLGLRVLVRLTVPPGVRAGDGFAAVFVCWEIAAVLAVQAGTAVVLGMRRTRMMVGLFATTLGGLLCCLALWALHRADACLPGLGVTTSGCLGRTDVFVAFEALRDVGVLGSVLTVAGVLLGRVVRRPSRSATSRLRGMTDRLPDAPMRFALTALVGVFVALAAWPVPRHARVDSIGVNYAPPHFSPAEIARESYGIWLIGGGSVQATAASTAFTTLYQAVRGLGNQGTDWGAVARDPQVRADCRSLAAAVARARTFPPPPGADTAAHWAAYLQLVANSADQCTAAAQSPDAATAKNDLIAAFAIPSQPVDAVVADMAAALKAAG